MEDNSGEQVPVTVKPTSEANGQDSQGNPTKVVNAADSPDHTITTIESDAVENLPDIESLVTALSGVKTGYKTSEFWITIALDIAALVGGFFPADSVWVKAASAATAGITSIAYIISRATVKKHALYAKTAAGLVATAPEQ